jgi:hypothetical protein
MEEDHGSWDDLALDERILRNYPVDEDTAHLIAQRFLELVFDTGASARDAYTGRQLHELLDQAAEMVLLQGIAP